MIVHFLKQHFAGVALVSFGRSVVFLSLVIGREVSWSPFGGKLQFQNILKTFIQSIPKIHGIFCSNPSVFGIIDSDKERNNINANFNLFHYLVLFGQSIHCSST